MPTQSNDGGEHERLYYGKYKGFVRENDDPEKRGRIRVFCPQIMGPIDSSEYWLDWAEANFPWLGGLTAGDLGPPFTQDEQVEDFGSEWLGVWVEFQGGQPDFPIWSGTWVIAPRDTSDSALGGVTGGDGQIGGGIITSSILPDGSEVGPLDPPGPLPGREVRLRAPLGVDIVIGNESGGYLILGASGAHLVGAQLTLNGAPVLASNTLLTK